MKTFNLEQEWANYEAQKRKNDAIKLRELKAEEQHRIKEQRRTVRELKQIIKLKNWIKNQRRQDRFQEKKRQKHLANARITRKIRSNIWGALNRQRSRKKGRSIALLGCSFKKLKAHLETQFKPGMTWENHGPVWHIDHKIPCCAFNLKSRAQQKKCFHYANLQPLFALENRQKGGRY